LYSPSGSVMVRLARRSIFVKFAGSNSRAGDTLREPTSRKRFWPALLPLVLGMLFAAPRWLWALFALLVALLAAWEWSRLCRLDELMQRAYVAFSGSLGVALASLYLFSPMRLYPGLAQTLLWAATAFWILLVPAWLYAKLQPPPWVLALAGAVVIWPMWVALVDLHDRSRWLLLATMVIVWIADIAAYFAGRRFGKRLNFFSSRERSIFRHDQRDSASVRFAGKRKMAPGWCDRANRRCRTRDCGKNFQSTLRGFLFEAG
jgi:CDP-diglyceride synthetase